MCKGPVVEGSIMNTRTVYVVGAERVAEKGI